MSNYKIDFLCIAPRLTRAELNKLLRAITHAYLLQRNSDALRQSYEVFSVATAAVGKPANHR